MKAFLKANFVVLTMVLIVGLAFLVPEAGASDGWLPTGWMTQAGVFFIFLSTGLTLPTESLRAGLLHWRLHSFIQGYIFVLIPLMMLGLIAGFRLFPLSDEVEALATGGLGIGFLFLAMLPTTIATANVFTSAAGGNVAASVFNTAVSNVVGIFILPLWGAWLLAGQGTAEGAVPVPVLGILGKIALLLLLPLLTGQALRPVLKHCVDKHRRTLSRANHWIVYFIIFVAFSDSVQSGIWSRFGPEMILGTGFATLLLLTIFTCLNWWLSRLLHFPQADRLTALFCGSQKTLAAGVPMATAVFAVEGAPELGLILLPLMFYHTLQIVLHGVLVDRLSLNREALESG